KAAVHHRRLRGLAAAGPARVDLDPGLDAAPGPPLGPAAPPGVRGGRVRRAALLVDREIGLPRAAAVRLHPRPAAGLAPVDPPGATCAAPRLSLSRTAAAPQAPRRSRSRPAAARAGASPA